MFVRKKEGMKLEKWPNQLGEFTKGFSRSLEWIGKGDVDLLLEVQNLVTHLEKNHLIASQSSPPLEKED